MQQLTSVHRDLSTAILKKISVVSYRLSDVSWCLRLPSIYGREDSRFIYGGSGTQVDSSRGTNPRAIETGKDSSTASVVEATKQVRRLALNVNNVSDTANQQDRQEVLRQTYPKEHRFLARKLFSIELSRCYT